MFSCKTATVRGYTLNFQTNYLQTNSIGFRTGELPCWKEGTKYIKNGTYKLIVANVKKPSMHVELQFERLRQKGRETGHICLLT